MLDDGGAEHYPVCVDLPMWDRIPAPCRRKRWALKKANWPEYERKLEEVLAEPALPGTGVREQYQTLCRAMWAVAKRTVPRGAGRKQPLPWWTDAVKRAVKERQQKRKQQARNSTERTQMEYLAAKKEAQKVIDDARRTPWRGWLYGRKN